MCVVTEWEPQDEWLLPPKKEAGWRCVYCGGLVEPPFVWWRGNDGLGSQLMLHPICVTPFTARLLSDAEEVLRQDFPQLRV